jgi:energy-converting hydrogenase Eha subunit E
MQNTRSAYPSWFAPIKRVLISRKYAGILSASALIYAFAYMVIVGVISYVPGLNSSSGIPVFRITSLGISAIPVDNVFFFIFYGALVFLVASSFLVGLNISLMFYSRKVAKACKIKNTESKGLFGLLPAFFTSFSCCGGGFLALAIGSTAFSSLSLYSKYMAPLTVAVLAAGTYFMSKKISKIEGC